jgi:hypothetical protein
MPERTETRVAIEYRIFGDAREVRQTTDGMLFLDPERDRVGVRLADAKGAGEFSVPLSTLLALLRKGAV